MTFVHPIIVHFPIALLTIYSLLEIFRIRKAEGVKAVLVILGYIGLMASYISGRGFGELPDAPILKWHERFAVATIILYLYPALSYIFPRRFQTKTAILVVLAALGLVSLFITGGMGGGMVFGTEFDPFMAPVFRLLGL